MGQKEEKKGENNCHLEVRKTFRTVTKNSSAPRPKASFMLPQLVTMFPDPSLQTFSKNQ